MFTDTTSLALLATAISDYESAWRDSVAAGSSAARADANERMREAYTVQRIAKRGVVDALGQEAADAVVGALIMAAARTYGDRPTEHRDHHSNDDVLTFIRDCIAGEAGL